MLRSWAGRLQVPEPLSLEQVVVETEFLECSIGTHLYCLTQQLPYPFPVHKRNEVLGYTVRLRVGQRSEVRIPETSTTF